MLSRRRRDEGDASDESARTPALTIARDVVEIVAIIAAGAWAFYTFVYENQIKPTFTKPEVQVESGLTRLGTRNGLIAVKSHVAIKDVGLTEIWLYGMAETVDGVTVRPHAAEPAARSAGGAYRFESRPGWSSSAPVPVFTTGFLTELAARGSTADINLRIGQSLQYDRVFYVAADRYDELRTWITVHFSGKPVFIPFRFHFAPAEAHMSIERVGPTDTDYIEEQFGTLSLW
jgi:hypothetical protein